MVAATVAATVAQTKRLRRSLKQRRFHLAFTVPGTRSNPWPGREMSQLNVAEREENCAAKINMRAMMIIPTPILSVGVGRMFGFVCLFVCPQHKRIIPKCSNWHGEWPWDITEMVWFCDLKGQRSRSHGQQVHFSHYIRVHRHSLGGDTSRPWLRRGFELYECHLVDCIVSAVCWLVWLYSETKTVS